MEAWLASLLAWLALPQYGLGTLFVVAFVSATLLPMGSEPALFGLIKLNPDPFWPGIVVATLGNTLGGMVDWWLGYGAHRVADKWKSSKAHVKALDWLARLGPKACLLSWLPVVGDPLCAVAGWLRLPLWPCAFYMMIGKLLRYLVMTWALLYAFPGVRDATRGTWAVPGRGENRQDRASGVGWMTMIKSYQELFDRRGSAYDSAMRRHPRAREQEFIQAIEAAQIQRGMVVADVPAGGGYLRDHLPAGCTWLGHEPCASFTHHGTTSRPGLPLLPLPWPEASVDAAISLAGVHHVEDKRPLFADLWRVVKPGGRLVVSDVATGSAVARFLDGYVGRNNSTGHEGVFLDTGTLAELRASGWIVQDHGIRDFHWVFASRPDMACFCHELFDLRTSSATDTQAAIEAQLGVSELANGSIGMAWSLMTIVARKP